MRSAGCFGCLSPHQHLQVQTYLLAVIGGFSTSATGVQTLSRAATCFSCLTKVELIRLKQYLMALWLGLDTSQAGIQTLVKAASCVPCLTPRQQQLVQTYLLTVSAGLPTNSTGVQAIEGGAKCFACLLTKQQYEVQVYILATLSGATFTIPADLVAAAKCFESCLPFELEEILQTSLIVQAAGRLTPPCVTPAAPIASAGAKVITNTTIRVLWNEINTGSLVTSYTVKWGTTSGVYTNSVTVPVSPTVYTITGLTPGTQYFWVIVANSFTGCSSANSNEGTGTTTGGTPSNGLLNNLISYWEFDANVNPYPDQKAAHDLTPSNTSIQAGGIINNCVNIGVGGSVAFCTGGGDFSMGAGVSFFFSLWVKCNNFADVNLNFILSTLDWNSGPTWGFWLAKPATPPGGLQMSVQDTGGNFVSATTPVIPTSNAWHHVVCGFDSANSQVFIFLDNGARTNAATVTNGVKAVNTAFHVGAAINDPNPAFNGFVDEMGFWKGRVPTAADVNALFNGGAGLPFSSFTT